MTRRADPIAITHRQWRPHYESRPYRMHPARREHIHGRVHPADPRLVRIGRRIPSGRLSTALAIIVALIFAAQFVRPLLGHHAASDAPLASGSNVPTVDAGRDHQ